MNRQTSQSNAGGVEETAVLPLSDLAVATTTERREDSPLESAKDAGFYGGVVIGTLVELDAVGQPRVQFPGAHGDRGISARSAAPVSRDDVGRLVALLFEQGDPRRPILIGVIQNPLDLLAMEQEAPDQNETDATLDGQRVVLTAEQEIVLQCGKASITLTRAGKVLLRGAYVSSRSSGANRIKGGSVQIN